MTQPIEFASFQVALSSIQAAKSKDETLALVDLIDSAYAADELDMTPKDWGHLASAVLTRGDEIADQHKKAKTHADHSFQP